MLCEEIERLLHNLKKKIFEVMSEYVYYGYPRIVFTLNSIAFCNMKHINGKKIIKNKDVKTILRDIDHKYMYFCICLLFGTFIVFLLSGEVHVVTYQI